MSILKPGTRCVIVAGCPENIGLVVVVIERLARWAGKIDPYRIRTVSGRPFHQLWDGGDLLRDMSDQAVTDRHKLRPLVDPKVKIDVRQVEEVTS